MKGNRLLFGIVVVLLLVTSVLPGCNEEQQLVIPSALSPYEVFNETAYAGPRLMTWPFFVDGWTAEDIDPYGMPEGASEEQFIQAFSVGIPEFFYIKRDGKQAGYEETKLVLYIVILKYEDAESAERSFINISETQGLQNSTYEGIALKNGTYSLPFWWEELNVWDERNQPCYLIHSGCFVIYFFGREDIINDMLDRIIVSFGVKE
jgi:hypothetical protein